MNCCLLGLRNAICLSAAGAVLWLDQMPEGGPDNHIVLDMSYGEAPPPGERGQYHTSTAQGSSAMLDMFRTQLKKGKWFIRLGGVGQAIKEYHMDIRIAPKVRGTGWMQSH